MGAPPPEQLRQPTPDTMPHLPGTPPVPPSDTEAVNPSELDGVPPWYVYIHTPLPSTEYFNLNASAKDRKRDKDFKSIFADRCRNIHWLVHYLLCGNAADIHFADIYCLLSEPDSEDAQW